MISINSTGNTAMTHALAAGTGYFQDPEQAGATPPLRANKVITAGAHSLYLSIFDQGDTALDSAVVLDNLRAVDEDGRPRAPRGRRPTSRRPS